MKSILRASVVAQAVPAQVLTSVGYNSFDGGSLAILKGGGGGHSWSWRKRMELLITETELKLIAAAATIGDSSRPNAGYSAPAAIGTPSAL